MECGPCAHGLNHTLVKEAKCRWKNQPYAAETGLGFVLKAMLPSRFLGRGWVVLLRAAGTLFSTVELTAHENLPENRQKLLGFHSCVDSERHFTIFSMQ